MKSFATVGCHPLPLEPEVLQCLSRTPIEHGGLAVIATSTSKIALRNPRRSPMRARGELREGVFRLAQRHLGFVEPLLLEKRTAQHEPRVPDLVHAILPSFEPPQGVTRLALGPKRIAGLQVHLCERRDHRRYVVLRAVVEGDRERLFQAGYRLLRPAEQELEASEVVEQPPDVGGFGRFLVLRLGALRVGARENPVAVALGDERGLEIRLAEGVRILDAIGQLEGALDVLPGCLVVR